MFRAARRPAASERVGLAYFADAADAPRVALPVAKALSGEKPAPTQAAERQRLRSYWPRRTCQTADLWKRRKRRCPSWGGRNGFLRNERSRPVQNPALWTVDFGASNPRRPCNPRVGGSNPPGRVKPDGSSGRFGESGTMRTTVPASPVATQTEPKAASTSASPPSATSTRLSTRPVSAVTTASWPRSFAMTHARSASSAIAVGSPERPRGVLTTRSRPETSTRVSVPASGSASHTAPAPAAMRVSPRPRRRRTGSTLRPSGSIRLNVRSDATYSSSARKRRKKYANTAKKTTASLTAMITPAICWSVSGEIPQTRGASA